MGGSGARGVGFQGIAHIKRGRVEPRTSSSLGPRMYDNCDEFTRTQTRT